MNDHCRGTYLIQGVTWALNRKVMVTLTKRADNLMLCKFALPPVNKNYVD